jgi:ABC-type uncharacterized transport system substrate-binding protein
VIAWYRQVIPFSGATIFRDPSCDIDSAGPVQDAVADLVGRRMAVIVASPIPAALAVKAATATIPVVFAIGSDPVESGLVARLNRPSANITGISFLLYCAGVKARGGAQSLFCRVACEPQQFERKAADRRYEAASTLGVQVDVLSASSSDDINAAFATLVRQRAGGLVVSADPFFISQREQLIMLAAQHTVPAIYYTREFTEDGGLMSYGSNFAEAHRQAGNYVGQILKGEKPGDLPLIFVRKV